MAKLRPDALCRQRVQHGGKARILRPCKGRVLGRFAVRDAEVREHALDVQMRKRARFQQLRQCPFVVICEKADARHAGVELQMHVQDIIRSGQRRIQLLRVFQRVDLLRDVHKHHRVGKLRRRIAEDEQRRADAAAPKLHSLLQIGDRQIVRAELAQRVAQRNGAVAVSVGLHHAEKAAAGGDMFLDRAVVVLQIIQRHLRPCSSESFHSDCLVPEKNDAAPPSKASAPDRIRRREPACRRRRATYPL